MFNGHENPTWITSLIVISFPTACQNACDTIRADNFHFNISTLGMVYPDFDVDMFEFFEIALLQHILRYGKLAFDPAIADRFATRVFVFLRVKYAIVVNDRVRLNPSLRFD